MQRCDNCQSKQGPFRRIVMALTPSTTNMPAKNQIVITVCPVAKECNERRAKKEDS